MDSSHAGTYTFPLFTLPLVRSNQTYGSGTGYSSPHSNIEANTPPLLALKSKSNGSYSSTLRGASDLHSPSCVGLSALLEPVSRVQIFAMLHRLVHMFNAFVLPRVGSHVSILSGPLLVLPAASLNRQRSPQTKLAFNARNEAPAYKIAIIWGMVFLGGKYRPGMLTTIKSELQGPCLTCKRVFLTLKVSGGICSCQLISHHVQFCSRMSESIDSLANCRSERKSQLWYSGIS
ncbi:hypothetical protein N7G274_008364 [Stereocaulon virgatum]|uniref:Uncharacterized protein n=1 Tax=Stereocaulon virgatum TaxID=373712 RepID=A0ABR3ZYT2_9LECA